MKRVNTAMANLALRHFGGDLLALSDINTEWVVYYLYPGTTFWGLHGRVVGHDGGLDLLHHGRIAPCATGWV